MTREPLAPEQLAEICEAYRAGACLRPLSKAYQMPRAAIRALLVDAGVEIRPSKQKVATAAVTSVEREARVRTVAEWLVDFSTNRHEILRRANDPEGPCAWGVELDTIDRYLAEARALLREPDAEAMEDLRAVARAQFRQLWREANDTKTRLAVLDRRLKFEGSDAPTKTEVSGPNGGPMRIITAEDLTDDELAHIATGCSK